MCQKGHAGPGEQSAGGLQLQQGDGEGGRGWRYEGQIRLQQVWGSRSPDKQAESGDGRREAAAASSDKAASSAAK